MSTQSKALLRRALVLGISVMFAASLSFVLTAPEQGQTSPATEDSLDAQLQAAANAALAYRANTGHLPASLSELRSGSSAAHLPSRYNLDGVMYFRDTDGPPRLSWHDDSAAAYCMLKFAAAGHCL